MKILKITSLVLLLFLLSACPPTQKTEPLEQPKEPEPVIDLQFELDLAEQCRKNYDKDFLCGVGAGSQRIIAHNMARNELAQQIVVNIDSQSNHIISEWMKNVKKYYATQLKTSSKVCLAGAEIVTEKQEHAQYYAVLKINRKNLESDTKKCVEQEAPKRRIGVKINYTVASDNMPFKPFQEGSVLHTGDRYKLIFEPFEDMYVYIFQIDSANKIARLFPPKDYADANSDNHNPVRLGQKYVVPAQNRSFQLDDQVGRETIYFIIRTERDPMLETQYEALILAQNDSNQTLLIRNEWDQAMKLRAPEATLAPDTLVTSPQQSQQFVPTSPDLKNLCDGCVYIVNFEHR